MYQDGHRRAKNQSNWSNASTVQVQKVRGPNILCVSLTFRWGGRAPLFLRPCCVTQKRLKVNGFIEKNESPQHLQI